MLNIFKEQYKKSVRFKFLVVMSGILIISTAVLSSVIATNERKMLMYSLTSKGQSYASYIAYLSIEPLIMKESIQLDSLVNDAKKDEDIMYIVIEDANGNVLTSQYASVNYQSSRLKIILPELSKDSDLPDIISAVKNKEAVTEFSAPILSGNQTIGKVTICMSQYNIRKQIVKTILFVIALNLAVAFVLGVVLFIASKKILLDPISELVRATAALADGDLSIQVKIKTTGEVQTLVDSFNRMAEDLNKTTVSKDYVNNIIKSMINSLIVISTDGRIIRINDATCRLLGYEEKELLAQSVELIIKKGLLNTGSEIQDIFIKGFVSDAEKTYIAKDGREIPVLFSASVMHGADNTIQGIVCAAQDITELKNAEQKIIYLAYYDSLTGLPNRRLFGDRFEQTLKLAKRYKRLIALLFIDLDNFKQINDTLGHEIGDLLLKKVAMLLEKVVRSSDSFTRKEPEYESNFITRQGGDEFIIMLTEVAHPDDAAKVAGRILGILSEPFVFGKDETFITASIGISIYPHDGPDLETILKNADTAMYYVKEQGKNNYKYFKQSMHDTAYRKLTMENYLRKALDRDEFILYYQPQINMKSGRITGLEALIRWKNPDLGMVSPADFIPLAEETGLILPIGDWVIKTACRQQKGWKDAGISLVPVSINLSSKQFQNMNIITIITQSLEDTELHPQYLVLEITESVIMKNIEAAFKAFHELSKNGLRFSLDDFGTGYSSLSYLKKFPIYTLKIDQSFVRGLGSDPDDEAITNAIISMAHNMKMKVIAEGVETEQQLKYLINHGCDDAQGYIFSRPLPAEETTALLIKEKECLGIYTPLVDRCRQTMGEEMGIYN